MRRFIILLISGVFLSVASGSCRGPDKTPNAAFLARVGGAPITEKELGDELKIVTADGLSPPPDSEEWRALRRAVLKELVNRKLLVMEAGRSNLRLRDDEIDDGSNEIYGSLDEKQIESSLSGAGLDESALRERVREKLLVEKLFRRDIYPRILVKDEEVLEAYETSREKYKRPETVRVRQIVLETEEEARKITRRLYRGEKFEKLAQDHSIMPERDRGGDLGWVQHDSLPEPFGKLVFELPRRIINKPIKSNYGYHIFQITDHLPEGELPYEKVRGRIWKEIYWKKKAEAEQELLTRLRKRYGVELAPGLVIEG